MFFVNVFQPVCVIFPFGFEGGMLRIYKKEQYSLVQFIMILNSHIGIICIIKLLSTVLVKFKSECFLFEYE